MVILHSLIALIALLPVIILGFLGKQILHL